LVEADANLLVARTGRSADQWRALEHFLVRRTHG
jgi:hypothetical protein